MPKKTSIGNRFSDKDMRLLKKDLSMALPMKRDMLERIGVRWSSTTRGRCFSAAV